MFLEQAFIFECEPAVNQCFFLKKETKGLLSDLSQKHIPSKNQRKHWHANKVPEIPFQF